MVYVEKRQRSPNSTLTEVLILDRSVELCKDTMRTNSDSFAHDDTMTHTQSIRHQGEEFLLWTNVPIAAPKPGLEIISA